METDRGVAALFAAVAGIGPFFAVATGPAPAGGGWVPVSRLDDGPLAARIAGVRAALDTDARVAASIAFQGLAAQLVAPLFAAAVVERALPRVLPAVTTGLPKAPAVATPPGTPADALHWRPGGDGPWLWWAGGGGVVPCPDAVPLGGVLLGLLTPLVAAVRARVSVSGRVLWGDVASAVASARSLVAAARPEAAARAADVARHLLATPPLAATAALRPAGPSDRSWTFRRRSCCLYYRVPGGAVCGDCVLLDRPGTAGRARPRLA